MLQCYKQSNKAQRLQHGKVAVDMVSKALSTSSGGTTGQVVSALSPAGAYAIGQYFKHNDSLNHEDGGNRAGEGSKSHLLAHGLLALAVSSATGQSPATITTATITTMGAEALAPKLSQYLYGTEKVADLNTEQKQTISNVLGTVGLVAGAVTAQETGADSISSVNAGQQVQGNVQNAVENNHLLPSEEDRYKALKKEYTEKGCFLSTKNANCQKIALKIKEYEIKGSSILKKDKENILANDMTEDYDVIHQPNDIVPCVISSIGYCRVTDQSTANGKEWKLQPLSEKDRALVDKKIQEDIHKAEKNIHTLGHGSFMNGCTMSMGCQGYFAFGGKDPFTGQSLTTDERFSMGFGLATQVLGAGAGMYTNIASRKAILEAEKKAIKDKVIENNVNKDNDISNKPIKITGDAKNLTEYADAVKFSYLNGGGEFKFSPNKNQQGIEGYFINQAGHKIPVSLKNLETSSPRKVVTVINKNAKSILDAEALPSNNPHKLPIGTLKDTILHIQTPNITRQQLVDEIKNYPLQGNGGKYKTIIFETKDGAFILQNGEIRNNLK